MEEDPSVFAYDEVYDEMKEKAALPKMQDKVVREVIPLLYARDCLVAV
jgi:coiled-coil domain-containing protein 55